MQNVHLTPITSILSWQGRSLVKGVKGSNRFVMSLEHQLKLMSPCKVLRTVSLLSQEPKTRYRTPSICYKTGMSFSTHATCNWMAIANWCYLFFFFLTVLYTFWDGRTNQSHFSGYPSKCSSSHRRHVMAWRDFLQSPFKESFIELILNPLAVLVDFVGLFFSFDLFL